MTAKTIPLALIVLLLSAAEAAAHKFYVHCDIEGDEIIVSAYYPGSPAVGADVKVVDSEGGPLLSGQTDEDGKFRFRPGVEADITIRVVHGEHFGEVALSAGELPAAGGTPPGPETGGEDARINRVIKEIRELREETRWRDIVGVVGYIFGLAGVAMYFLSKKQGRQKHNDRAE